MPVSTSPIGGPDLHRNRSSRFHLIRLRVPEGHTCSSIALLSSQERRAETLGKACPGWELPRRRAALAKSCCTQSALAKKKLVYER